MGRVHAEPEPEGTHKLWNPPPRFSDAICVWVEPKREATCRYQRYEWRGEGSIAEEARLVFTEDGWEF